jgi:hypothetical protein
VFHNLLCIVAAPPFGTISYFLAPSPSLSQWTFFLPLFCSVSALFWRPVSLNWASCYLQYHPTFPFCDFALRSDPIAHSFIVTSPRAFFSIYRIILLVHLLLFIFSFFVHRANNYFCSANASAAAMAETEDRKPIIASPPSAGAGPSSSHRALRPASPGRGQDHPQARGPPSQGHPDHPQSQPQPSQRHPSSHAHPLSHPPPPTHLPHPDAPHLLLDLSPTNYAAPHESRRRNAEQRAATLRADVLIREVEPNRVFCSLCTKWVQLRQDSSYCAYPWLQHRGKCLAR